MKTIIFLFLFSFSTISSVHAKSGQEWLSDCESGDTSRQINCLGYLEGVRDMYRHMVKSLFILEGTPYTVCYPTNITTGQEEKIMMKHLNDNPEQLHFTFSSLYKNKMMMTFPCKEQDKK
jgi:hypothetical protein